MIKNIIAILVLLIIFTSSVFSISTEEAVKAAIEEFEEQVTFTGVAGIGNFVFADKNIGSSYSLYLQELASQELQVSSKFIFAGREHLDKIMEEMSLGLTGLTEESNSPEPGMLRGLEYLVAGRFFDEGESVKLFVEMIEMESGIVLGKVNYSIAKSTIPANISLLPDNYNDALYILEQLSDLSDSSREGLEIRAWSIRGEGGIYRDSEDLVIRFYTSKDCYLKIYHIDVDKKLSLIFPNPYYSDNLIKAGKIYKIPDQSYPFNFSLGEPYGTEFIKVIASTVQFDDFEESFSTLGVASGRLISRGLNVGRKDELTAETMFSYTIVE